MSVSNSKKTAVVTGASSGIGAVYADRLAARGYDLIVVARRSDRLEALVEKISKVYGAKVEVIVADLEKEAHFVRVEKILATNPAVHVLVNNTGLSRFRPIGQSPVQDSLSQIALNITSLPISSLYSGTKAFVLNFSRGLRGELAQTGVKVQVVLPASTATEVWNASGIPLSALEAKYAAARSTLVCCDPDR